MIDLHFCEYNRSNQDYDTIFRPSGSGDYLLLLLKTPMKVYLKEGLTVTRENACILYTPGFPQHYQAVRRFCNSYLHFSSGENPAQRFRLPENRIFYPTDPQEFDVYFRRLQQEFFSSSPYREEVIHCLATELFIALSRSLSHPCSPKGRNGGPVSGLSEAPAGNALQLRAGLESGTPLQKRQPGKKASFTPITTVSFLPLPKAICFRFGWKKQKNLLSNEALQVGEVARLCGFSSLSHFSRYFRKYCGCSPKEYKSYSRSALIYSDSLP